MSKDIKSNIHGIAKKIGIFLLVIVLFTLVVCVAGLAYLFLVPNSELFGIVYAKNKTTYEYNIGDYNVDELKSLNVSTNRYDVEIMSSKEDSEIRAYVKNDISGLVKSKNSKTELIYKYDGYSKALDLSLEEMSGWVSAGNSKVLLVIPYDLVNSQLGIKVVARKGAEIRINGFETDNVAEKNALALVDITNNHGAIFIDSLIITQFRIKTASGKVELGSNVSGIVSLAEISVGNGIVDFRKAGDAQTVMAEEGYDINTIDFKVEKIILNQVGNKGKLHFIRVGEMASGDGVVLSGGNCEVKNLSFFSINSKDFNLSIENLNYYANSVSEFRASGTGMFNLVGKAYSSMNIVTKKGDIKISNADEVVSAESYSGKIQILNANREVSLINIKGNSYISFGKNSPQYNSLSKFRCISSARIKSGKLIVEGLNKINLTVEEGGKPNIELLFNKIIDKNVLNVGKANLLMVTPNDEPFELNYFANEADTDISIGTVTRKAEKSSEEFFRYVFCEPSENDNNTIEIHSSGKAQLYSLNIFNELKYKLKCEIGNS